MFAYFIGVLSGQDENRRVELRKRVENYMIRVCHCPTASNVCKIDIRTVIMGIILSFQAEYLKKHVDNEKEAGKYHEQIEIADK